MAPQPCHVEANGEVLVTRECEEGHQCLLEATDVTYNSTTATVKFCAYPADVLVSRYIFCSIFNPPAVVLKRVVKVT